MERIKHFGALFLTLVLSLSLTVPAFAAEGNAGFSDVDDGAPYAEAVNWTAEHGYFNGYADGRFGVNDNVTRAQLSAVLYRAAGSPAASGTTRFSDVSATAYYVNAASWAADNGLINGYQDGRFGVGDPVTRQQVAAILWRWAGSPEASAQDYTDETSIAAYARTAVDWSRTNNIITGRSDGRFEPAAPATRVEIASALYQYMNRSSETPAAPETPSSEGRKVLIAYFSATNNTENIANHLNAILDADLYEITPEQPYTSADLNYGDSSTRATAEQNDPNARPAISGSVDNMEQYDVIFLGYPIWWGQAPKIIYTFLESYDLSGKTIVPFCTSGSSGIGSSATNLHALAGTATWLDGQRFSGSAAVNTVRQWVDGLNLPTQKAAVEQGEDSMLRLSINGTTLTATLEDNSSAQALRELLADGPRTIQMSDYMSMEKVGPLGTSLPANDVRTTTQAGDIILYQSNQIVIYYAPNTYTFTRLGRINDTSAEALRTLLGSGDVSVTLSLTD